MHSSGGVKLLIKGAKTIISVFLSFYVIIIEITKTTASFLINQDKCLNNNLFYYSYNT